MDALQLLHDVSIKWHDLIPTSLRKEDPWVIGRLITFASRRGGACQGDLLEELGVRQPRLSKLTKKLTTGGWLVEVALPNGDHRQHWVKATPKAVAAIRQLNQFTRTLVRPLAAPGIRTLAVKTVQPFNFFNLPPEPSEECEIAPEG